MLIGTGDIRNILSTSRRRPGCSPTGFTISLTVAHAPRLPSARPDRGFGEEEFIVRQVTPQLDGQVDFVIVDERVTGQVLDRPQFTQIPLYKTERSLKPLADNEVESRPAALPAGMS
jgi:hypothetical protein